eukprot:706480-Amorphochlora_amoeboformis.AAC.1
MRSIRHSESPKHCDLGSAATVLATYRALSTLQSKAAVFGLSSDVLPRVVRCCRDVMVAVRQVWIRSAGVNVRVYLSSAQ